MQVVSISSLSSAMGTRTRFADDEVLMLKVVVDENNEQLLWKWLLLRGATRMTR
jgi:hypothetical protein